jgi:hypothetical protein
MSTPAAATYVTPPTATLGSPSRIQLYEVTSVNADGTINCRLTTGRAGKVSVPYPPWYGPQIGDRVYVADLNGSSQQPYVISPLDTGAQTLGAPDLNVGSRAAILFDPGGAGTTFPSNGVGLAFTGIVPNGAILIADGLGGSTWRGGGVAQPVPAAPMIVVEAPVVPTPILPNGYATNGLGSAWTLAMDEEFQGPNLKLANAGGYWGYGWYPGAHQFDPTHISYFGNYVNGTTQAADLGQLTWVGTYPGSIGGASTAGSLTGSGLQLQTSDNGGAGYNDGSGHTFTYGQGFLSTAPNQGWGTNEPYFAISNSTAGFYIEARMWCPGSGGLVYNWPSFWMTGIQAVNGVGNGYSWPTSQELDVMEGLGGHPAAHWHGASSSTGTFTSGSPAITGVPSGVVTQIATSLSGSVPVYVSGACVSPQTTVLSASGTTVTLTANAIGSGTGLNFAYIDDNDAWDVGGGSSTSADFTNGWHTYGALMDTNPAWGTNGVLQWYYDGVLFLTRATPFIESGVPLHIVLSGGLGGGSTLASGASATILVDYVRVWHR